MKIDIRAFNVVYFALAVLFGIGASIFNIWYGIAVWALVAEGVFHEPAHWVAAKFFGFRTISMLNSRNENYIEIETRYEKEDDVRLGYVALAGALFNLLMYSITGAALALSGVLWSGIFFIIAMEIVDLWYGQDYRTFWKLSVEKS